MANRFQTPVDNQFINTYTPIPFQEMMDAAAIKQDRWDTFTAALNEAVAAAESVPAIIGTPDEAYAKSVDDFMKERASYYSNVDISDPMVMNQLNADLRTIDNRRLQNIAASRANWDQEQLAIAEMMQDQTWNQALYDDKSGNWDSRTGIYTGNAEAAINTSEFISPYFDGMQEEFIKFRNAAGGYNAIEHGILSQRIKDHAANITPELMGTTWAKQQLRLGQKENASVAEQQQYIQSLVSDYAEKHYISSTVDPYGSGNGSGKSPDTNIPVDIPFLDNSETSELSKSITDKNNPRKTSKEVDNLLEQYNATIANKDNVSEDEYTFALGNANVLNAAKASANTVAKDSTPNVLPDLKKEALQTLQDSFSVSNDDANKWLSLATGTGLDTWGTKIGGVLAKTGDALGSLLQRGNVYNIPDEVVSAISAIVPAGGYYNIEDTKKDISRYILENSDNTHVGYSLGDYISEYITSVGDKYQSEKDTQNQELFMKPENRIGATILTGGLPSGVGSALLSAGDIASYAGSKLEPENKLSIIRDYAKQYRDYNRAYEKNYNEALQNELQYMTQSTEITLPSYSKESNSTAYYTEITNADGSKTKVEAAIPKFINNLKVGNNFDGFVVTVSDYNGKNKEQSSNKPGVVAETIRSLDWSKVEGSKISTAPKFDEDGTPYFTLTVGTGTGQDYKDIAINISYNSPAYNTLKEDLYAQGTPEARQTYMALTNMEIPTRLRDEANLAEGADFTFKGSNSKATFHVVLDIGRSHTYKITSSDYTYNGQPVEVDDSFDTIEEAQAALEAVRYTIMSGL